MLESLDPRVRRLPEAPGIVDDSVNATDQLGSFEVFVQAREGKPFQHEGAVRAADLEMAFILAKETFTRRFLCHSLWVVETQHIFLSPFTDGNDDVYSHLPKGLPASENSKDTFEIFHLYKRGKQHVHFMTVSASNPDHALLEAAMAERSAQVYNVWVIRTGDIRKTKDVEMIFWATLPEKKFRDAAAYKGGDKLKDYLDKTNPRSA
jgi:ring-1,2-phenylacetyl-CoA epoxidase subunit PaaB